MSAIKGRFKSVEIAADGSEVKVRLVNGADESVARIRLSDVEKFIEKLIAAMVAAKMNNSVRPEAGKKFSTTPTVVKATDVNVNWMAESNHFAIEVSDERGRKAISVLSPEHMRFLVDVFNQTNEKGFGGPRH